MSAISTWSTTAANNNNTSPNGWPEGMPPSGVNDSAREMMAQIRNWYDNAEWADDGVTKTRTSASQFTITGDYTGTYQVGRRVKMTGSSTDYGTISASSYGAPNTTVTISEANIPATLTTVQLGVMSVINSSIPGVITIKALTVGPPYSGDALTASGPILFNGNSYVSFGNNGYIRTDATNKFVIQSGSVSTIIRNNSNSTDLVAVANAGNVTIAAPSSGDTLTISAVAGARPLRINSPDVNGNYIQIYDLNAGATRGFIGHGSNLFSGAAAADFGISTGGGSLRLSTDGGATTSLSITNTRNVTISTPSSGVTLTANGILGQYHYYMSDGTTTGGLFTSTDLLGLDANNDILIRANGSKRVILSTNASGRLIVNGTGNVTIDAPSSGQTLLTTVIAGSSGGNIFTDGTVTGYQRTTAATSMNFGTNSAHALTLNTNDTQRVSIASAGNVTINAPSSGRPLTVNGSGTTTSEATQIYEPLFGTAALAYASTYESGSYTGTLTGCTTSPTGTFNWTRCGSMVTIDFNAGFSATSNSPTMTVTGGPSILNPARAQNVVCRVLDNNVTVVGLAAVVSSGTITFGNGIGGGAFTSSGQKGVNGGFSITYSLI